MSLKKFYCPFRKEYIQALPEEIVRLSVITHMVENLGYPKSSILIEKLISNLPHLQNVSYPLPKRRIDIICYSPSKNIKDFSFSPLLLIECKSPTIPLSPQVISQVAGYNYHIKAPFIAVTNGKQFLLGKLDGVNQLVLSSDFPAYKNIIQSK